MGIVALLGGLAMFLYGDNIAVGILEMQHDKFDTHSYAERMKKQRDEQFDRYIEEYRGKYHF